MPNDGLATEYENAVADVLAYLAGDKAVVERDVRLPGRKSMTDRQIDIFVRGTIFGMTDATMAVDCKRWSKRVNVVHAGAFTALVEDVGADFGLLISTQGSSPAARQLLQQSRGLRIDIMSLDELNAWAPSGTRDVTYRIKRNQVAVAAAALRRAGFRVRVSDDERTEDDEVALKAFRYYPLVAPHLTSTDRWGTPCAAWEWNRGP